ncbi:hypothetical protein [Flavobacterium lacus]|uniref:Uncharacterized protein n=1 Tax=Flavobacterium lacus TaxID=1353778 RepID=A0A328WYU2_9FLAO|nr:hypothetical protein [Flavobacterium lacus]RAR48408.1 hypothetical protein B0I10_10516 [Flavobacterium lacus]
MLKKQKKSLYAKTIMKIVFFFILINFNLAFGQTEKVGVTKEIKEKNINWEEFDQSSSIQKSEIKLINMQGLWKAYEGIYKFNEHVNAMKLTEPFIFEVKKEKYRRNSKSKFKTFTIKENIITMIDKDKVEVGIINKITETEIIISWKNNLNYTRYYYKK